MLLFFISFLMVFVSSYFLASIFAKKQFLPGVIYTMLIAFAQVISTIEFLSLFSAISKTGILIINAIFLTVASLIWYKKDKPLFKPQFKRFFVSVFNAMKKDKMLAIMACGFVFFLCVSIFLCWVMPVVAYDSLSYHFNRALFWVSQGSLAHFEIADGRNIYMAINSEILYTWFLTFVYENKFIGFFQFAGYIFAACSLFMFLGGNGFCMRKKLWTLFLFSSISGVLIEASGMETDVIIGGLVLASMTLFLIGAKASSLKNSLVPIYFSSLAVSIAVGTKTSAFFVIPAMAIIFAYLLIKYQKDKFWKYCGVFLGFSVLNFLLFSAYNYILNFIEFGNLIGTPTSIQYHRMEGGIKGYISGVVRHLVLLLDFTGFSYGYYMQKYVFAVQDKILTFLHIPLDLNVITSNNNQLNFKLNDSYNGGGVITSFVMLPCMFIAICRGIFAKQCVKKVLFALLGLSIFISILFMSSKIGFMCYSSRFIVSFLVFASPVLVISYIRSNKNILKYLILFYVMSYFILVSTHIWQRRFINIIEAMHNGIKVEQIRDNYSCNMLVNKGNKNPCCALRSEIYKMPAGSRIGIISRGSEHMAIIKLLENKGYKIDVLGAARMYEYDLKQYDAIVFAESPSYSTYISNLDKILENYSVENNSLVFKYENRSRCLVFNKKGEKSVLVTQENRNTLIPSYVMCDLPFELLERNGFQLAVKIRVGYFGDDGQLEREDEFRELSIFKR